MSRNFYKLYKGVSGVYKITNRISGEFYIGASCNVGLRWLQHMSGQGLKIQNDIQSLGVENFTFEVIEEIPREELPEREQYWITKLGPSYNISVGRGKPGCTYKHTEEAKLKMSKAKEGFKGNSTTWRKGHKPWNVGIAWTEEQKKKQSERLKGRSSYVRTEESRKKSSEAQKNRPKYKWLFPDGSIKELSIQHASRHYLRKGIEIKKLEDE